MAGETVYMHPLLPLHRNINTVLLAIYADRPLSIIVLGNISEKLVVAPKVPASQRGEGSSKYHSRHTTCNGKRSTLCSELCPY